MNKITAKKVTLIALQANALLNQCLTDLESDLPEEELRDYYRKFGKSMGETYLEILEPLWEEHPDLLPVEMEGTFDIDHTIFKTLYKLAATQANDHT